jgi:hypothetical protein
MSNIFKRINDAMERRLKEQVDKGKGRGGNTDQTRAIGTRSTLNGRPVYWSGQNYGWQTKASHEQLKNDGAFRVGQQNLQRIGNDISTTASRAWNSAPKPVRDTAVGVAKAAKKELWDTQPEVIKRGVRGTLGTVDKGLEAVSRATNTSRFITDEAVTAVATLGAGVAAKHGGKTLGRIGQAVARRVDDIPAPVTRQAAGRGVANRIQRRLDDAAAARRAQDAGRVSTGAPGSLDPKVRGGRRPINPTPKSNTPKPKIADLKTVDIHTLTIGDVMNKMDELGFDSERWVRKSLESSMFHGVSDRSAALHRNAAVNMSLGTRQTLDELFNKEYYAALRAKEAALKAARKANPGKHIHELPGDPVKPPMSKQSKEWHPELAQQEQRRISRSLRRRKELQDGAPYYITDAKAPIAEVQTTRPPNGGVVPERFEADKAPKKGDPITRTERESIDRLNARTSGRQLTKAEQSEQRKLRAKIKALSGQINSEPRDIGWGMAYSTHSASLSPDQIATVKAFKQSGGSKVDERALLQRMFDEQKAKIAEANAAYERLDRLERIQRGRNGVAVKEGRSTRIKDRIARDPDLDPRKVGVTKARQNTIEAAERNADKGRIALATRRRMTKESRGRLSPYGAYTEQKAPWGKRHEVALSADNIKAIDAKRTKDGRITRKLRDIERTKQYRDYYNKAIPEQEFDKVQSDLRKQATEEWRDNSYNVQAVYKSEATYVRSNSSRKQVEAEIKFRRHREYMKKHGVFDEARFDERLIPKTDNPAGRESVKNQFREARRRRGVPDAREKLRDLKEGRATEVRLTGDTRYRGLSRRQPNGTFGGSANPSKRDNLARPLNGRTPTKADKDVQKLNKRFQGISPLKPSREAVAPVQGAKRSVPPTDPADRKPGSYRGRIRAAVERSVPAKPTRREASVLRPTGIANKARQRAMDHGYPTRTELRKQKRLEEALLKIKRRRLKEKNQGS